MFMRSGSPSLPGRIFSSLFLLPFFVITVWFSGLLVYSFFRMVATYAWEERDCTILSSGVKEHREDEGTFYSFQVLYSYTVGGWRYTGDVYRFDSSSSTDIGEARRLVDRYPEGSRALCYVNPRNPSWSMLRRPAFWIYLLFPVSVLIAAVTGFGVYGSWRPRGAESVKERINRALKRIGPGGCMTGFSLVFLVCGLAFASFFFPSLLKVIDARSWPVLQCTILGSEVITHPGDGESGPTYSLNVFYTYTFAGREYKANRYRFLSNSAGDLEDNQQVARSLPPRARVPCYVNPAEPAESVLDRSMNGGYAFGLFPLLFLVLGLGGIILAMRGRFSGWEMTLEDDD
jgi:hypothetical protein